MLTFFSEIGCHPKNSTSKKVKDLHTNASRSISSVSSITSAVVGTYGIVTVRIDITDMAACCTLVKIWKEKLKITELSKELRF